MKRFITIAINLFIAIAAYLLSNINPQLVWLQYLSILSCISLIIQFVLDRINPR